MLYLSAEEEKMLSFRNYLTEVKQTGGVLDKGPLTHLTHPGSLPHLGGARGTAHGLASLRALHNRLAAGTVHDGLSTKFDGAPAFIYSHDEQGPSIATKSAFNKNPKINRSLEDIEKNHGHAPGLVAKLKKAFTHLQKVVPQGMTVQGDIMHGGQGDGMENKDGQLKFKPNTIEYGLAANSPEGKKAARSKLGVAIHTVYKHGVPRPITDTDRNRFRDSPDVHNITSKVETAPSYQAPDQHIVDQHLDAAQAAHEKLGDKGYAAVTPHGEHLETYINQTVRKGTKPNVDEFKEYLYNKGEKEASKVKTEKSKEAKRAAMKAVSDHVDANARHFTNSLNVSHHLQQATNHLSGVLGSSSQYSHNIAGQESGPEGHVLYHKSQHASSPIKIVNRGEGGFAQQNLNAGGVKAAKSGERHITFGFGRLNPPTTGHEKLAAAIRAHAASTGGDHLLVVSKSQDAKKNPLSVAQKVKHAKRILPGTNIEGATADAPTFIDYLRRLHKQGYTHLTMVAGSDRIHEYQRIINKYNGSEFNFKSAKVISAGDRDPDAEGAEGMSASKMRKHAENGDFKSFKEGLPKHVSHDHAVSLYNDVRKGMNIK